ncbi:spermidine synthase [Anatilimnocola sp. NA78]|uniref:spermidine synthase n=1 Tax=Anatilimnocola sp. NA78 TaxID=3415683 RepID=UPI003CE55118
MSDATAEPKNALAPAASAPLDRQAQPTGAIVASFAATIFLSAFLLFQVQPLLSKFILPWFGGSPAVWTAAMLFFQLVLFGGYLYAHLLSSWCSIHQRLAIHLSLLAIAAVNVGWGKLLPPESLRPQGLAGENPLGQVLLLLGVTVGIPYFVLSSTGPLLQKWFHDTLPHTSPYRLFALSNLGSLLALLTYPFFFEVFWGVHTQTYIWSIGYLIFIVFCGYCAVRAWQAGRLALANNFPHLRKLDRAQIAPLNPWSVATWLALPALASVMFLAFTNEVCQNVASVPLLWVVPLSLYLLSFIIAFDHPRWYSRRLFGLGVLLLIVLVTHYEFCAGQIDLVLNSLLGRTGDNEISLVDLWWLQAACYFLALFGIATMCHGELARSQPAPQHLTTFYLTMSFGGALGGLLINLAAPYLFDTFFEFPIGLTLSAITAATLVYFATQTISSAGVRWALNGTAALLGLMSIGGLVRNQLPQHDSPNQTVHISRNFYGIVEVMHRAIGDKDENYTFFSGTVQHGKQLADPARRKTPLTYYGEGSGCEVALKYAQAKSPNCRIGVVGLGVGTIATYARASDSVRLYEINPAVIDIAQDTRWFHYLGDCEAKPELVLGDARLQLEQELRDGGSQKFDVLVMDAFSGDSIPTHLLTREAFEVYFQHLKPDGLLVVHITNTHLDLYPVVQKLADHFGYGHRRIYQQGDTDRLLYRNYYMLITKDEAFLNQTKDDLQHLPEYLRRSRTVPMWTDDYTNLTSLLR